MTPAEWALVAAAIGSGVCGFRVLPRPAVRNATAAVLFGSWALGFVAWYGFGHALTAFQAWYIDCFVIAVIFCKARRTGWDWAVIALFAPMWYGYFATLTDHDRWGVLWWAAMAQFISAGLDTLLSTIRAAKARPVEDGHPPGLRFAVAEGGGDG